MCVNMLTSESSCIVSNEICWWCVSHQLFPLENLTEVCCVGSNLLSASCVVLLTDC